MIGKAIRLQRLFNGNLRKENIVICAVDHGMFQGVQPGLKDLGARLKDAATADAILLGPGMIERFPEVFYRRGGPSMITRLGFTSAYCFQWDYHEGHSREMFDPAFLQALGADAIVTSLQLHTSSQRIDAENAEAWGRVVMAKERLGLPLVGEFHPAVYENVDKDEWHELIKSGCRILCELGADMIKTFYTDERFAEIAAAVPIPIFVLGSKKMPQERDMLLLAEQAVRGGARGVAIGRNIFQASSPRRMIEALKLVVKRGKTAEEAAGALEP
jgi:fructose-bisphosphate aldolase/2-amino-3,7-dideoxy-D-threo-hept-6-ulosonate synthase